ncbi:MAG TPA: hypothetical protein VK181_23390 [Rhizobium sp.]|nr:hypothetical protein [Rhizobium sp.]
MIEWRIDALAFSSCNCAYNCPCQFELRPPAATAPDSRWDGSSQALRGRYPRRASLGILDARTARVEIAEASESVARPIISPATAEPQRIRVDLPTGIEFAAAEIASASTKASDPILLDLKHSYGQLNAIHHTGRGAVRQDM